MTSYQMTDIDGVEAMCICIEFAVAFKSENGGNVHYVREDIEAQWARRYPKVQPPTKECTRVALKIMMGRELSLLGGRPPRDITGSRNGALKAIRATGFTNIHGRANWLCECQCEETYLNDVGLKVTRPRLVLIDSTSFSKAGRVSCSRRCAFKQKYKLKYHMRAKPMRDYPREIEKWQQLCGTGELDYKSPWFYSFEDFINDMGAMPNGLEGREYKNKHGNVIPPWQVSTVTLGKRVPEMAHGKGNTFWQPRRIPQEHTEKRKRPPAQWKKEIERIQLSGSIYIP